MVVSVVTPGGDKRTLHDATIVYIILLLNKLFLPLKAPLRLVHASGAQSLPRGSSSPAAVIWGLEKFPS